MIACFVGCCTNKNYCVTLQADMLRVFLISLVLLLSALALMAVRIIVKKNGTFSSEHIGENKRMKQRKISCAASQHRLAEQSARKKLDVSEL